MYSHQEHLSKQRNCKCLSQLMSFRGLGRIIEGHKLIQRRARRTHWGKERSENGSFQSFNEAPYWQASSAAQVALWHKGKVQLGLPGGRTWDACYISTVRRLVSRWRWGAMAERPDLLQTLSASLKGEANSMAFTALTCTPGSGQPPCLVRGNWTTKQEYTLWAVLGFYSEDEAKPWWWRAPLMAGACGYSTKGWGKHKLTPYIPDKISLILPQLWN